MYSEALYFDSASAKCAAVVFMLELTTGYAVNRTGLLFATDDTELEAPETGYDFHMDKSSPGDLVHREQTAKHIAQGTFLFILLGVLAFFLKSVWWYKRKNSRKLDIVLVWQLVDRFRKNSVRDIPVQPENQGIDTTGAAPLLPPANFHLREEAHMELSEIKLETKENQGGKAASLSQTLENSTNQYTSVSSTNEITTITGTAAQSQYPLPGINNSLLPGINNSFLYMPVSASTDRSFASSPTGSSPSPRSLTGSSSDTSARESSSSSSQNTNDNFPRSNPKSSQSNPLEQNPSSSKSSQSNQIEQKYSSSKSSQYSPVEQNRSSAMMLFSNDSFYANALSCDSLTSETSAKTREDSTKIFTSDEEQGISEISPDEDFL